MILTIFDVKGECTTLEIDFGDDIFTKSIRIGQYIRLSIYCIVTETLYLISLLFC